MTESDKVVVHVLARILLRDATIRIPFRRQYDINTTLKVVIDNANEELSCKYACPTISLECDLPDQVHPTIVFDDLSKWQLSQLVAASAKEVLIIADYNVKQLDRFVHRISLAAAADDEESKFSDRWQKTTTEGAMELVVAHLAVVLPDAHGIGETFSSDIERLASALGDGFIHFLPSLMPQLITSREYGINANCMCLYGIFEQKKAAGEILHMIARKFSRSLGPYILHLETLVMRQLCFADEASGTSWAAGFMPSLLATHKTLGGMTAARSLWTEYWAALLTEINANTKLDHNLSVAFLNSIGSCIVQLGAKASDDLRILSESLHLSTGMTAYELEDIGSMLERELVKSLLTDTGNAEDYELERMRMSEEVLLKSAAELIRTGCEVIGDSFLAIVRPLLEGLCSRIAKWEWGASMIECLADLAGLPELRENNRHATIPADNCTASSDSSRASDDERDMGTSSEKTSATSSEYSSDDQKDSTRSSASSITVASQETIDSATFANLFNKILAVEESGEKRDFATRQYKALPAHEKASLLWAFAKSPGEETVRCEAMKRLESVVNREWEKLKRAWTVVKMESFGEELIEMVQSEVNDKMREVCGRLLAKVAEKRYDHKTGTQTWAGIVHFIERCAASGDVPLMISALQVIMHCPHILGKKTGDLRGLFEASIGHGSTKLRITGLSTFEWFVRGREQDIAAFSSIFAKVMESASNDARCEEEHEKALACLLQLANKDLDVLRPHLAQLFPLCIQLASSENREARWYATLMLPRIVWKGWAEVTAILGEENIAEMCRVLLKRARVENDSSVQRNVSQLIAVVAQERFDTDSRWPELLLFMEECAYCKDGSLDDAFITIINDSPLVFLGEGDSFMRKLRYFYSSYIQHHQEEDDDEDYDRYLALGSIVSLVNSCEGGWHKTLDSMIRKMVKQCKVELARGRSQLLDALQNMADGHLMQPHLPALLALHKRATRPNEDYIRLVRRKIAENAINIHRTHLADKSAYIPFDPTDAFDARNEEEEVNLDDELFGEMPKETRVCTQ